VYLCLLPTSLPQEEHKRAAAVNPNSVSHALTLLAAPSVATERPVEIVKGAIKLKVGDRNRFHSDFPILFVHRDSKDRGDPFFVP
jgi:hypothetical protein